MADGFVQKTWAAADNGGGWIEYEFARLDTHEAARKTAFIARVDEEVFIGAGVFREDQGGVEGESPSPPGDAAAGAPAARFALA